MSNTKIFETEITRKQETPETRLQLDAEGQKMLAAIDAKGSSDMVNPAKATPDTGHSQEEWDVWTNAHRVDFKELPVRALPEPAMPGSNLLGELGSAHVAEVIPIKRVKE